MTINTSLALPHPDLHCTNPGFDPDPLLIRPGDLKHPANRNPPVGCDSATGSFLKELVVYEDTLSFPIAQVRFKLLPGADIPDPYKCDAINRGYLRDLRQVSMGQGLMG